MCARLCSPMESAFWGWAIWAYTEWASPSASSASVRAARRGARLAALLTPAPWPDTACAGVPPHQCLPVHLDVGTENEDLLGSEVYLGLKQRRLRGAEYDAFVLEFMRAAAAKWGEHLLLQFEDFGNVRRRRGVAVTTGVIPARLLRSAE
jgi:hypothetical protein